MTAAKTRATRPARLISPKTLGLLALLVACFSIGLVAYGAWVRVSGSGLGCPDWPLCEGATVPQGRAAAIESGHRVYAGFVGLAVLALAVAGFLHRDLHPKTLRLLATAFGLVVAQGLLGAVVVFTNLQPLVRLAHLVLAMGLVGLLTVAGTSLLQGQEPSLRLRRPGWHVLLAGSAVILLGGSIVASTKSFECAALPLCDNTSSTLATALHSAHRTLGVLLLGATAFLATQRYRRGDRSPFMKAAVLAAILLTSQVTIGFTSVALGLPTALRILHIGVAASIWAALVATWNLSTPVSPALPPRNK